MNIALVCQILIITDHFSRVADHFGRVGPHMADFSRGFMVDFNVYILKGVGSHNESASGIGMKYRFYKPNHLDFTWTILQVKSTAFLNLPRSATEVWI